MSAAEVVTILNQLLVLHSRSLPVYLMDARPWMRSSDQAAADVLKEIGLAHIEAHNRLAEMVLQRGGTPAAGEFPMLFTGYNDLSLEYLVGRMIERGEQAIKFMKSLAARLGEDSAAQNYAEELVGEAMGHVDSLKETQKTTAPALKVAKLG